jgi:hypothetical protein
MIKIQCSILEQVRLNPTNFGKLLALNGSFNQGGSHGMFAYWQDISLKIHKEEFDLHMGLKELQKVFLNFEESPKNLKKQDFLQDAFTKYHTHFFKKDLKLIEAKRRITWNITSGGLLTGLTPWVFKSGTGYYTYFFSEQDIDWTNEVSINPSIFDRK